MKVWEMMVETRVTRCVYYREPIQFHGVMINYISHSSHKDIGGVVQVDEERLYIWSSLI